jgi:hypothetical protein
MSALDGVLEVGDLVWQQMYSPTQPRWEATLEERIEGGVLYGPRRLMRLVWLHRDGIDGPCPHADDSGLHPLSGKPLPTHSQHWHLAAPGRERDRDHYSIVDDNWCLLEHAEDEGALF